MFRNLLNGFVPLIPIAAGEVMGLNASLVGTILIGLAALAVLVNQIAQAVRWFRGKPVGMEIAEHCPLLHAPIVQRLDALEDDEQSARTEMNQRLAGVSHSFTSLRQEIKSDMAEMKAQAKNSDRNLHDRMNVILERVSELKGAFDQSQRRTPT